MDRRRVQQFASSSLGRRLPLLATPYIRSAQVTDNKQASKSTLLTHHNAPTATTVHQPSFSYLAPLPIMHSTRNNLTLSPTIISHKEEAPALPPTRNYVPSLHKYKIRHNPTVPPISRAVRTVPSHNLS